MKGKRNIDRKWSKAVFNFKSMKAYRKVKVNKSRKKKRSSATSENHDLGLHIYKGNMEEEHKLTY